MSGEAIEYMLAEAEREMALALGALAPCAVTLETRDFFAMAAMRAVQRRVVFWRIASGVLAAGLGLSVFLQRTQPAQRTVPAESLVQLPTSYPSSTATPANYVTMRERLIEQSLAPAPAVIGFHTNTSHDDLERDLYFNTVLKRGGKSL